MRAIDFEGSNCKYAEHQPEYETLPAHRKPDGEVVSCWQLTWRERWRVLWSGRMWLRVLTYNDPLQPLSLTVDKPEMQK